MAKSQQYDNSNNIRTNTILGPVLSASFSVLWKEIGGIGIGSGVRLEPFSECKQRPERLQVSVSEWKGA